MWYAFFFCLWKVLNASNKSTFVTLFQHLGESILSLTIKYDVSYRFFIGSLDYS